MKIIRVLPSAAGTEPGIDFHPDSALLLPGRPLFYPDFGEGWMAEMHLAVRLNRLGKGVSERFAARYYDAFAPAMRLSLPEASPLMQGALSGMDFSITHGTWLAPDEAASAGPLTIGGREIPFSVDTAEVARLIAMVSRLTTVKMGDLLLLPTAAAPFPLTPRSRFIATDTATGRELLNVKIV